MHCWWRLRGQADGEDRRARADCVFCAIAAGADGSRPLLYADDRVVAFHDRAPAAAVHILVCPRQHIASSYDLRKGNDAALVKHMLAIGRTLVAQHSPAGAATQFGVHLPPFTSVDHLHLHCFALPFASAFKALKYPAAVPLCGPGLNGTPWYMPAETLVQARSRSMTAPTACQTSEVHAHACIAAPEQRRRLWHAGRLGT